MAGADPPKIIPISGASKPAKRIAAKMIATTTRESLALYLIL